MSLNLLGIATICMSRRLHRTSTTCIVSNGASLCKSAARCTKHPEQVGSAKGITMSVDGASLCGLLYIKVSIVKNSLVIYILILATWYLSRMYRGSFCLVDKSDQGSFHS